jgi:hypothetical protein
MWRKYDEKCKLHSYDTLKHIDTGLAEKEVTKV